jgi:hypothetical protein
VSRNECRGVSVAWLEDARTRVRKRDAPSGAESDEKSVGFWAKKKRRKRDVSRTSASLSSGNGTRHAGRGWISKKKTPSRVGSGVTHVFQLLHRPEGGGLPASPAPGGPRGGGAAAPRLLRAEQTLEHDLGSRKCHPRGVPCSPESRWRRPLPFPRARSRKNEGNRVASTPSTTGSDQPCACVARALASARPRRLRGRVFVFEQAGINIHPLRDDENAYCMRKQS